MAENKAIETTQKLNRFWYEAGQAIVQSTFEIQSRSLWYMQATFTEGMETLKSHIDASLHRLQRANMPQNQQEPMQSLIESGVEAYKRNITFLQRTFEHGIDTFRGNTDIIRDLTQTLIKKAQEQRETSWP